MRVFEWCVLPPLWLLVLCKAPSLRAAPRQHRVMWVMWAVFALAFTIGSPAVRRHIDHAVGVQSFTNLPVHMLSLAAMGVLGAFIRELSGHRGRRQVRSPWFLLGLAEAGLVVAFAATPLPDGEAYLLAVRSPSMTAYWTIFLGYVLHAVVSGIRLCRRYGRHASPGPSRTSMRLLGLACSCGLLYAVHRLVHLLAGAAGWPGPGTAGVVVTTQVLLACTMLLLVTGVLWPSLAETARRARLRRQVRAIRPLWRLLTEATPEVVLPLAGGLKRDVELVRYRYVIEVRDSALALSGHVSAGQREAVRRAVAGHGAVSPAQREATAEAVVLLLAARAEHAGVRPRFPEHALVQEGADLETEAEWLGRVAAAVSAPAAAEVAGRLCTEAGTEAQAGTEAAAGTEAGAGTGHRPGAGDAVPAVPRPAGR
ncbi:MAB_1171c family putative transporter [Streptomyces sp. NPDC101118]|uniref:MAB_1171c family putative transporter n=1 Tax=Streptomyces sp. NPDC101118 TaxID=3366109 RepID=UPI0037F92820